MYMFNGVATEIASALSPQAFTQKIPAQDILHWEMLLEAKKAGCHTFDMAGVNPNSSNPKEAGIRRFKEKWGGRYVEYQTFEKQLPLSTTHQIAKRLFGQFRRKAGGENVK
jgi:lipid II:glycine glycyltransferase (peptidoglycan interpeptide bridge formation enzyme)